MKWFACGLLALFIGAVIAEGEKKEKGTKGTVVFVVPTQSGSKDKDKKDKGFDQDEDLADWVRVGSFVNVVIEEPGTAGGRTVFEGRRVSAIAEERREKDGLALTVQLTAAQAKAFEALEKAGTVKIERRRDARYYSKDK